MHVPSDQPPLSTLFIVGPTASGKSSIALALARQIGGEIVNADAFQLYQGLDILTAKPSSSEQKSLPHHLFSVLKPSETCDAGRYRSLALPILWEIESRGVVPIVVGGSGLYLKALTHGIDPLPKADVRLRTHFETQTLPEKVEQLLQLDPNAASNVPLNNPRYVERALEICLLTGQPQSTLRHSFQKPPPQIKGVCLDRPRSQLYQRINQRVEAMFAQGALAEVAAAHHLSHTVDRAIGVREIQAHLRGEASLETTVSAIQQATRRYAKRQLTWFRRETCFQTICLNHDHEPSSVSTAIRTLLHV